MFVFAEWLEDTYDFFKNVDLVEEHALLIFVHVALPEDLDGSLRAGFSVDAHADFAKGTFDRY